jgi:hexosaminidase
VNALGRQASGRHGAPALLLAMVCACSLVACTKGGIKPKPRLGSMAGRVIPAPVSVQPADGVAFTLTRATRILTPPGSAEARRVATYLAELLRRSTGYPLPVADGGVPAPDAITFVLAADAQLGDEGYRLDVAGHGVTLRARRPEGLFRGVQTLRQLLPPAVEGARVSPGPWTVPGGRIVDRPRFAWRGASLDVVRHFFTVAEVERYLDLLALYKLNVLHLHLTDDQGWRIAIASWPRLATYGGSTEVGGGPGGYYTQRQYSDIVAYARERYITVIPEVDAPGHTNAALASYPQLSCNGHVPKLFTGTDVGFSSLCVDKPLIYKFIDDVIRELAALTPGPYIHIGGDEAQSLSGQQYGRFVEREQRIVQAHGKRTIGWQETAGASLLPTSVVQYWNTKGSSDEVRQAARRGAKVVLSPASRAYLDMKYDEHTTLGLEWAGHIDVRDAYGWDPAKLLDGIAEDRILGVEAAIWSETLRTMDDVEFMAFPRLPAIAEVGWSPASARGWAGFRLRLAQQAPRWSVMRVRYYRSPQVPWPSPAPTR